MKYKLSKYNYLLSRDNSTLLYNCASDGLLLLVPQLVELIKQNAEQPECIKNIHEDLFQALETKGFIVSDEKDEIESFIDRLKEEESSPAKFSIIINPTMDCNLRCWYCYENHTQGTIMSSQVINSIKNLIHKKLENPDLKELHLSFFGGEPLIQFRKVIQPILEHAIAGCEEHNVKLGVSFTTNGVLLNEQMMDWLKPVNDKQLIGWQITLDGYRELHDKSRRTVDLRPTYDIIVKNIKSLVKRGMTVTVRFNYTADSLESFVDVLQDFEDLSEDERRQIHFDFQQVWQANRIDEDIVKSVKTFFLQENFEVGLEQVASRYRCYADKESDIVVNYNGDLYKCTAREFNRGLREGVLLENGELVWNNLYKRRMSVKYANSICKACRIYPLCFGGCSQRQLERERTDSCPRKLSEEDKDKMLRTRALWILQQQNKT